MKVRDVKEGAKREPIPHAIDVGALSQVGADENAPVNNVYAGRGFEGPKPHETSHKSGSQGKY